MKTNAWAAQQEGGPLELVGYEHEPEDGQVVIDVMSCSLTRGDVRFIDNFWHDTSYPLVTGLEVIGNVREDIGGGSVFNSGDIVGVGYQVGACFACEYCQAGKEQFCAEQRLIPFHAKGGFADTIAVDRRFVFLMPKKLQVPQATPLLCAGLTVFTPIHQAQLQTGATVGVVGIGGLGHLAVLFLAACGCDVTAFTHSEQKIKLAGELGAKTVITDEGSIPERAFDFIICCASDGVDWQRYIHALKPEGTLCVVGLPADRMNFSADLLADRAARRIVGNYIGSRADMTRMLAFASEHNILARTRLYGMQDVNQAIDDMRANRVDFSAVLTH
jgi:uncharacterized zinc-type alcohol dehydrogenase-like protein